MCCDLKVVSNVLRILGGIGNKTIAECLFDFAKTTNPTGGIIGTRNSIWFQNLMLKVFGVVTGDLKKVLKNHACIYDVCSFLFKHLGIGYTDAMSTTKVITVSSMGSGDDSWSYLVSMLLVRSVDWLVVCLASYGEEQVRH